MTRPLDNNRLPREALTFPLNHFIKGDEDGKQTFLLKGIKENHEFEEDTDGKKRMTDRIIDKTLTLVDMNSYAQFNVKVDRNFPLTEDQFASADDDFYAIVNLKTTMVKIWKVDFSGASVSIKATDILIEKA